MFPFQFLGDIAGMLEIFAIAAGLVLLHHAGKASGTGLLKAAGWILVVGGIVVGLCTIYYWFSFRSNAHLNMMHGCNHEMMHPGMAPEGGHMPHRMMPPGSPGDAK